VLWLVLCIIHLRTVPAIRYNDQVTMHIKVRFSDLAAYWREHRHEEAARWQLFAAYTAWREAWPQMVPEWLGDDEHDQTDAFCRFLWTIGLPTSRAESKIAAIDARKPFGPGNCCWTKYVHGLASTDSRSQRAHATYARLIGRDVSAKTRWPTFDAFLKELGYPPEDGRRYRVAKYHPDAGWENNAAWEALGRSEMHARAYGAWSRLTIRDGFARETWPTFDAFFKDLGDPPQERCRVVKKDPKKDWAGNAHWDVEQSSKHPSYARTRQAYTRVMTENNHLWEVWPRLEDFVRDVGWAPIAGRWGFERRNTIQPHGPGNTYWVSRSRMVPGQP